jgi:protein-S-isoprenylcysteine O-methyltransferase Ste14
VVYLIAVRHEEAYLEHRFGDAYRNYRQRVRRWI